MDQTEKKTESVPRGEDARDNRVVLTLTKTILAIRSDLRYDKYVGVCPNEPLRRKI